MKKGRFAAVMLTAAIIMAPGFAAPAFAADAPATAPQEHHMHHHLTEAQVKLLRDTMHGLHEKDKATFEQIHALHKKLHDIVVAPNFDQKAFLDTTKQVEDLHAQMAQARVEAFAGIAGQFSPKQREHLIMAFAHHHMMHQHGMEHHHQGMPPHGEWKHEGEGHHDGMSRQPDVSDTQTQVAPLPDAGHNRDYPPYSH